MNADGSKMTENIVRNGWTERKVLHLFCLFCGIPLFGKAYILIPFFIFLNVMWGRRNWMISCIKDALAAISEFRLLSLFVLGYGLFALVSFIRMPDSIYTRTDGPLYVVVFVILFCVGFFSGSWKKEMAEKDKMAIFAFWIQLFGWIIGIDVLLKKLRFPYIDFGIVGDINVLSTLFLILAPLSLLSFFSKKCFFYRCCGLISFSFFSWLLFFCTTSDVRYVYWMFNILLLYFFHRSKVVGFMPLFLFVFLAILMVIYSDNMIVFLKNIDLFQTPFGNGKVPFFQKILNSRDAIWQGSLRTFGEYFWFGVGPANFNKFVTPHLMDLKQYFRYVPNFWQAHNIFLHAFVVTGIWGGLCFFFSALVQIRISLRLLGNEENWLLGLGIFIIILNTYLYGLFEPVVYNDALLPSIWGGLGYATATLYKTILIEMRTASN